MQTYDSEAEKATDDDVPFTDLLRVGQNAIHVVCHDCPTEALVVAHASQETPHTERAGAIVADHAATGHKLSLLEVEG
jgi:hypothetical protein